MITVPNRTDMSDESLALRTIDENLRKLAEDVLMEILNTSKEIGKTKDIAEKKSNNKTPRLHIAYANSEDGTKDFSTTESDGRTYIGIYTDFESVASTDPVRYKWSKIKGDAGLGIKSYTRWYYLAVEAPHKPAVKELTMPWTIIEPMYEEGSAENLYYVDRVIFTNDSYTYTDVQVSSLYAAAKAMYEKTVRDREKILEMLDDLTQSTNKKITETATSLIQSVESNYYSSAEMDDVVAQLQTQITQNSKSIEFRFLESLKNITDLSEDTYKQFNKISKYIRFEGGNIILGQEGSEMILKLENNRISFIQNGNEVSYWKNNKLYVSNTEILEVLKLGKFAFIPNSNGSLSFKKVEG